MKNLLPIVLSANRKSWRMLDSHADETDTRYHAVRSQVLDRDNHTCAYCGFKAEKYQEVHHLDDDHGHNNLENLVVACAFCHIDFHLAMAGIRNAGVMIFCPEYTQADLNNLVRAIFIAVANKGVHEDAARTLYNGLETRASVIEESLFKGASSPSNYGQGLLNMPPEACATQIDRLGGVRLLPRMNAFAKQIAYWQSDENLFGAIPDKNWDKVLPKENLDQIEA